MVTNDKREAVSSLYVETGAVEQVTLDRTEQIQLELTVGSRQYICIIFFSLLFCRSVRWCPASL